MCARTSIPIQIAGGEPLSRQYGECLVRISSEIARSIIEANSDMLIIGDNAHEVEICEAPCSRVSQLFDSSHRRVRVHVRLGRVRPLLTRSAMHMLEPNAASTHLRHRPDRQQPYWWYREILVTRSQATMR